MRGSWIAGLGLLLLVGCQSDGVRGPSLKTDTTPATQGLSAWRADASPMALQGGTPAERSATARVWATMEALVQTELSAAELVEAQAPSTAVQDYAARVVQDDSDDLRALRGVARAKAIAVDAPEVRLDPIPAAERRAADEALGRLRALRGDALEVAYLTAQPATLARLGALGEQGERAATDVDEGNVLRTIAQRARERAVRADALVPERCGGPRSEAEGGRP